jgi:hypothetical protein
MPRALDTAEKQQQYFTHSAVVWRPLFGSDAAESEEKNLRKVGRLLGRTYLPYARHTRVLLSEVRENERYKLTI